MVKIPNFHINLKKREPVEKKIGIHTNLRFQYITLKIPYLLLP